MNLGKYLLLTLGIFHLLHAEDSFQVEVSSNKIGIQDSLSVYITTSSAKTYFQDQPQINSKDFEILPSVSNSTSIQIINGKTSFSQTYTYLLKPKTTGTLSFSSSFAGNSKETSIEVVSGSISPRSSIPNQSLSPWDVDEEPSKHRTPPLVKYSLSKTQPYLNEPIFVNYYYYEPYGQGTPESINMEEAPNVDGGILSPLPKLDKADPSKPLTINGVLYTPHRLLHQILIPLRSDITFHPGSLSVELLASSFSDLDPLHLKLKITGPPISVKKLPPEPSDFSNIFASELSLISELEKDTYQVNKPIIYNVHLRAHGNLRFFSPPKFTLDNSDVNLVEDKLKETPNDRQSVIEAEKNLVYYITPKKEGKVSIPSLNFTFFNYEKNRFERLSTKPLSLEVEAGHQANTIASTNSNEPNAFSLKKDLSKPIPRKYLLLSTFCLSFIVFALIIFYFIRNLKRKQRQARENDLLQTIESRILEGEDTLSIIQFYLLTLAERNRIEYLSNTEILKKLSEIYPSKSQLFKNLNALSEKIERKKFSPQKDNDPKKNDSHLFIEILRQIQKNEDIHV